MSEKTCALCGNFVHLKHTVESNTHAFCCMGCSTVYQILSSQKALLHFQDHPLFQQALKSGLIANPELLEQQRQRLMHDKDQEKQKIYLEIQDMWCPSCAQVIPLILLQEEGIKNCVVDYSTDLASIEYFPLRISKDRILELISKMGYRPIPIEEAGQKKISRSLYLRFIVAAFFSLNIMMFAYPVYASYFHSEDTGISGLFSWLSFFAALPVITYSSWPIWHRFFTGLKVGIWGMEALVLLGVSTAFGLSVYEMIKGTHYVYFDSLTVIIVFVLLGKIIETKAKFSAKDSLIRLSRSLPRKARKKFSDGTEQFVLQKEMNLKDLVVVLTGEKIPVDGIVVEGEGACDESLMTGESIPLSKKKGDLVLTGSILQRGRLVIEVTTNPCETALHQILAVVEQDIGHKAKSSRLIDQIVRIFVPMVLVIAVLTALYCLLMGVMDPGYTVTQTALIRAMSVLLISCPCAIGIAVPLVESHLLNEMAKVGAIIRNRGCLAFLGKETVFVFDKTGTITEGKFSVLEGLEKLSFVEKSIIKGMVTVSTHPICHALNEVLLTYPAVFDKIEEVVGKGIRATHEGNFYLLGSGAFLADHGIDVPDEELRKGEGIIPSKVYFSRNQTVLATLHLGDRIRPEALQLLKLLRDKETWLLSGDSEETVKEVAVRCGFKRGQGGCHPLEKRNQIDLLRQKGEIVLMCGDGVNDAPAITAAHVGIAPLVATDMSIQVSDILLTTDRLSVIACMQGLAKKGRRIVKENLFWAFIYNILGIGLAVHGSLSPIFAASAMVLSSLIVLFNTQKLKSKQNY